MARLVLGINRSFKIKLILSLSVIILLSSVVTGYLTHQSSMQLLRDEIGKQYLRTNEDVMAKFELNVQEVYRISQAIVFNPLIENKIKNIEARAPASDPYGLYDDKKQIDEQIFQIKLDAPYITGLYLYDMNGNPSYFSFNTTVINTLDAGIYRTIRAKIDNTSGDLAWMSLPLPSSLEPGGYRQSIVVSRWMKNSLLQTYGMLVITIDESFFSGLFKGLMKEEADEVFLYNSARELIYSNKPIGTEPQAYQERSSGIGRLTFVNDRLYAQSFSAKYAFALLSGTSLEEVRQKNRNISEQILYAGLLSMLVSSVLVVLFTGKLLRPLKRLVKGLHKVRNGAFDTRIEVRTKDELAYIGESFNAMTEQVERLIKEVYMTQLSEREAELRAIQAQLNPHYLHNLFNEIYWKLFLQGQKETSALIKSVAETMNYTLMPVRTLTTVREELEHIRHYLKLQAELFETDLETRIEADEDALNGAIPRFLLQPLVENVFMHAFRDMTSDKRLFIGVRRTGEELAMEVADNGAGMDRELVSRLQGPIGNPYPLRADNRESLGIRSVRRRIELVYGPPYGLYIDAAPGSGTVIRLRLPYGEHRSGGAGDAER
ncbi:sensor histidine kinase [Paenibacillus chartarius]|uniref:histidine kinase n=1 Tax=Paenibacillus chartarius TaxID=747481 RepID=A0ABV6DSB2_9BACL